MMVMKTAKAMTIRLSGEQAEALDAVAAVDGRPVAEVIRTAIAAHIEGRRQDSAFQDSLKERLNRTKRILGR